MARSSTRWLATLALAVAVTGVITQQTTGRATAVVAKAAPASIAFVDLERVLEQYQWVREQEQTVQADMERRAAELETLRKQIQNRRDDLTESNYPLSQRRLKQAELATLEAELQAGFEVAERLRQLMNGEILYEGYLDTLAAINQVASRDGYDLVLLDDRKITPPKGAPQSRVESAVLSRSILYANPSTLDISATVIDLLNNIHKSGKPIRDR